MCDDKYNFQSIAVILEVRISIHGSQVSKDDDYYDDDDYHENGNIVDLHRKKQPWTIEHCHHSYIYKIYMFWGDCCWKKN